MEVLSRIIPSNIDLKKMAFMTSNDFTVGGIACGVTRCGYTGEDGFEISVADKQSIALWETLLKEKEVLAAGLGVRDSLRLEAGLCLYGHELNETISPIEAGLTWTIGKRRLLEGGFLGATRTQQVHKEGPKKKLSGLLVKSGAPARELCEVMDQNGKKIGWVTSGGVAPSLKMTKIAMAYLETPVSAVGTQLQVSVRGKLSPCEVVKLPFVPTTFYRIPK